MGERYKNYLCAAVIVEPRKHCALSFVVREFRKVLTPKEAWPIFVYHGTENKEWVSKMIENVPNCFLRPMPCKNLSTRAYSHLLTSFSFWDKLKPYEKILIFQTDSLVFDEKTTTNGGGIMPFLDYDYIGAPWKGSTDGCGNGGLSLRSRIAMIDAICDHNKKEQQQQIQRRRPGAPKNRICPRHPEDVFFATYFRQANNRYTIPSRATGKTFSVEHVFYLYPFGIHKCWKHIRKEQWERLCLIHPTLKMLRDLQKEEGKSKKEEPQQRQQHPQGGHSSNAATTAIAVDRGLYLSNASSMTPSSNSPFFGSIK